MTAKFVITVFLLSLFVATESKAQDTYDYGVVRFHLTDGNDTLKTYVPKNIVKATKPAKEHGSFAYVTASQKELIKTIEHFQKQGWEVYGNIYKEDQKMNYQLRKKKN